MTPIVLIPFRVYSSTLKQKHVFQREKFPFERNCSYLNDLSTSPHLYYRSLSGFLEQLMHSSFQWSHDRKTQEKKFYSSFIFGGSLCDHKIVASTQLVPQFYCLVEQVRSSASSWNFQRYLLCHFSNTSINFISFFAKMLPWGKRSAFDFVSLEKRWKHTQSASSAARSILCEMKWKNTVAIIKVFFEEAKTKTSTVQCVLGLGFKSSAVASGIIFSLKK